MNSQAQASEIAPASRELARVGHPGAPRRRNRPPIGQILVDLGYLDPGDMLRAVAMRQRQDIPIGRILTAQGMVTEDQLYRALSLQFDCELADLSDPRPYENALARIGPDLCRRLGFVPWRRYGAGLVYALADPRAFPAIRAALPPDLGPPLMAIAPPARIEAALVGCAPPALVARAETRVDPALSCRDWNAAAAGRFGLALALGVAALALLAPAPTFLALLALALAALLASTALKAAAALATLGARHAAPVPFATQRRRGARVLPRVSIMVPLYRERAIAGRLIRRLSRLNYPRELLEILLVVERHDLRTQAALGSANLPPFMRRIDVPPGNLHTKPRALNFALDFCQGEVIGILDAEDAPEPDQLFKVTRRLDEAPDDVACLQGVLDFYNTRTNWLSRCFALEYASWFRVVLPGLERLGLAVPLGGTTLYFRRDALERIGGWDAHNVTEDADIGIRLARLGYRTEVFLTTTEEEANCRLWPWVRQRSRWLKGYAMTWAVHMRDPARLWRELGPRRFWGFQALFLGTIVQFLLAPLLWSFWAVPLGLPHPAAHVLGPAGMAAVAALFLGAEAVNLGVTAYATAGRHHRWLWPWIPTLHLYFPLATLALYRGLAELVTRPFYWDKTDHGRAELAGPRFPLRLPGGSGRLPGRWLNRPRRPASAASRRPG